MFLEILTSTVFVSFNRVSVLLSQMSETCQDRGSRRGKRGNEEKKRGQASQIGQASRRTEINNRAELAEE